MFRALVTAVRTLTLLPLPGQDTSRFADSLVWFPCVGALCGALLAGLGLGLGNHWSSGAAGLMLAVSVILTRGLHLDGLADAVDGFGGGRGDRARTLEIMKDPHMGAFGVMSIVLVLMLKWVAFERIVSLGLSWQIVTAYVISRAMQVELAVCLPYARAQGTAAGFVQGAKGWHRAVALSTAMLFSFWLSGLGGLGLFALAWVITRLFGVWCKKRVGGITGDLLGTCSELTETVVLFGIALL